MEPPGAGQTSLHLHGHLPGMPRGNVVLERRLDEMLPFYLLASVSLANLNLGKLIIVLL